MGKFKDIKDAKEQIGNMIYEFEKQFDVGVTKIEYSSPANSYPEVYMNIMI